MTNEYMKINCVLYTNSELTEREIKKTIQFIIKLKWIKYIGINFNKDVKGLYVKTIKY